MILLAITWLITIIIFIIGLFKYDLFTVCSAGLCSIISYQIMQGSFK